MPRECSETVTCDTIRRRAFREAEQNITPKVRNKKATRKCRSPDSSLELRPVQLLIGITRAVESDNEEWRCESRREDTEFTMISVALEVKWMAGY